MQRRRHSRPNPKNEALLAERAWCMRRYPTPSEAALGRAVGGKRLGVAFRRQVVIGGRYIADLVAPAAKLVVEIDGLVHVQRTTADARRDRLLERLGYRVLRLPAELVEADLAGAVEQVRAALRGGAG
jgi:very-short-patch-repair endonuclease